MAMPVGNLNAQSRSYELTQKINSNMMSVYDVNSQHLDILQGISKGKQTQMINERFMMQNSEPFNPFPSATQTASLGFETTTWR